MGGVDDKEAEGRAAARIGKLRYVHDDKPGLTRDAMKEGFRYRDPDGTVITDDDEIARIRKLAIPPAYRDVWICPDPDGHLQASGRDARGRKQYRYHARWREVRDDAKYAHMLIFGEKLPLIRDAVRRDLDRSVLDKRRVVAAVIALMEKTLLRVGNEEYARENKSFGLTTLRNRHATVSGSRLVLDFRGKHGIQAHVELKDRKLSNVVRRLHDLPGQHLFQFTDAGGAPHAITSDDVNAYLQAVTGEDITAKDFRTWAATNLAALALAELERFDTAAKAKKNVLRTVEAVAKMLGNTPSVCRKCYIHPAVFDGYLDGSLMESLAARAEATLDHPDHALTVEEVAVTAFLGRRLEARAKELSRDAAATGGTRARRSRPARSPRRAA